MALSFAVACKKYFGMLPGKTFGEFVTEVRALTQEDRDELAPLLSVELGEEVEAGIAKK